MTLSAALKMSPPGSYGVKDFGEQAAKKLDLPVYSFSDFDSVQQCKAAIYQLERGYFSLPAQLVDRMGWDDRIAGVRNARLNGLTSLPMWFEEHGSAEAVTALEDWWNVMFPREMLRDLLAWGIFLGVAPAQITWKVDDASGWQIPTMRVWHPQFLTWRWDLRLFQMQTMGGIVEVEPGDKEWVLYTPNGVQLGWLGGLVRSLWTAFAVRQWAIRDWARSSEVHGMPIRGVITPAEVKKPDKDEFLRELAALGRESVVLLPQAQDGDKFDLKLIEASADSHMTFKELIEQCNKSIAITLLGQNLTTEVVGGSYAAAAMHDRVRNDFLKADATTLGLCLREQVLKPWAELNFGSADVAPIPRWQTDPPEDKGAKAQAVKILADACAQFKASLAPVDIRALLDQYNMPMMTPAEEQKMKDEAAAAEAAANAPAPGTNAPGAVKPQKTSPK